MIYPTVRKFNKLGFATGKLSSHLARNAHFYGAAGGALAGAGVGYLTSDEKDKKKRLKRAALGGLLGAGAGYVGGSQIAKKQLTGELRASGLYNETLSKDNDKAAFMKTAFNREAVKGLGGKNIYDVGDKDMIVANLKKGTVIGHRDGAIQDYYNKRRKWLI